MKNRHRFYPLSILVTALVFYLSLFNPADLNLEDISFSDKLVHAIMYTGVSFVFWYELLFNTSQPSFSKILLLPILLPILIGGVLEILQEHLTECRSGEWSDFAADVTGTLAGILIGTYIIRPFIQHLRSARSRMDA